MFFSLQMEGNRRPNGYIEKHGKVNRAGRSIHTKLTDYLADNHEFGHLEGDTVIGKQHHGLVMTLVE